MVGHAGGTRVHSIQLPPHASLDWGTEPLVADGALNFVLKGGQHCQDKERAGSQNKDGDVVILRNHYIAEDCAGTKDLADKPIQVKATVKPRPMPIPSKVDTSGPFLDA